MALDNLSLPETEGQYRHLGKHSEVTSAQEKAEEFTEIKEELGKSPSTHDIQRRSQLVTEVSKGINGGAKEEPLPSGMPKYFNTEQLDTFRAWSIESKGINVIDDKPKVNMLELSSMREDVLNDLASRVPEWKAARKIMIKLLHPDSGGNTLAYQFFEGFNEIMDNLSKAYDYVMFTENVDKLKIEWWEQQ